jgi:membrane fusion protein (multidrug efflux system)
VGLGLRRAGEVEVLSGLAAGERIVVDGTGKLRPGASIRDVGSEPAAAAAAG